MLANYRKGIFIGKNIFVKSVMVDYCVGCLQRGSRWGCKYKGSCDYQCPKVQKKEILSVDEMTDIICVHLSLRRTGYDHRPVAEEIAQAIHELLNGRED